VIRCYRNGELDPLVSVASDFTIERCLFVTVVIASSSRRNAITTRLGDSQEAAATGPGDRACTCRPHATDGHIVMGSIRDERSQVGARSDCIATTHPAVRHNHVRAGGERRCCPSSRASADRVPIANERWTSQINSGSERQSNPVCGEAEQRRRKRDFCSRGAGVSRAYANAPHSVRLGLSIFRVSCPLVI
jgi:hypothetical protein